MTITDKNELWRTLKDEGSVQNIDYFYLEIVMIDKMNKCNPTIEIDTSFGTKLGFS